MFAASFFTTASGASPQAAFNAALQDNRPTPPAGHLVSLAQKNGFVIIDVPLGQSPLDFAKELVFNQDVRIEDPLGPAGCIPLGNDSYLFIG